jgi:hypothetical protein
MAKMSIDTRTYDLLEHLLWLPVLRACLAVAALGGGLFRADNSDKAGLRSRYARVVSGAERGQAKEEWECGFQRSIPAAGGFREATPADEECLASPRSSFDCEGRGSSRDVPY